MSTVTASHGPTSSITPNGHTSGTRAFLQPFYILSTVVGGLILLSIIGLAVRSCKRRREFRTRYARAVDEGWAVPVFQTREISNETSEDNEKKAAVTQSPPDWKECVLEMDRSARSNGLNWEQSKVSYAHC